MFVAGFPAGSFAANCYLVAPAEGADCVVVDPGEGAVEGIVELLSTHDLTPAGVLLTHGHLDHVWTAQEVCARYAVPCWIHPGDRHLLSDPLAGLPPQWAGMLGGDLGLAEPADVRELTDGQKLEVAGMSFVVDHAPGHTAGSVTLRGRGVVGDESTELLFCGDLIFAGGIGRTDLPGGDHETMLRTLAARILPLGDAVALLPGHGGQTSVGHERATNPFLVGLAPMTGADKSV